VQLLQRLAETREVVIFDNMRTGLSTDNSTAPLTIPMMASSTAALITSLKLQKPDIWRWEQYPVAGNQPPPTSLQRLLLL